MNMFPLIHYDNVITLNSGGWMWSGSSILDLSHYNGSYYKSIVRKLVAIDKMTIQNVHKEHIHLWHAETFSSRKIQR